MPIISPRTRGLYFFKPSRNRSPFRVTSGRIFSMTPMVARAAAQASGPPANVLPCSLFLNSSPSRATRAPMGKPLAIPFARVTISGWTPVCCMASHFPVRPMPVWTSSTIMSAPLLSQASRIPSKKLSGGMMTPASPWIGSTMTPAVSLSRAFLRPSTSPYSTKVLTMPRGSNGSRIAGLCVTAREPTVRPWNPCVNAMNFFRPVLTRASLRAPSVASAPELEKKALCIPVISTSFFARSPWCGT